MTSAARHPSGQPAPSGRLTAAALLTVFLPFACGYYLSYFFRQVNAIIAGDLQADLGIGASELGLLTSLYFAAFAAFQLPLGLLLDRFGPRRVNAALLLIAAAGAALFAISESLLLLSIGRALIGLGVAGCLMSSFKAVTEWFPRPRWPLINSCILAMGGLGAISATGPVELALQITTWRGVFVGLAIASAAVAITILTVVPDRERTGPPPTFRTQVAGLVAVYRDAFFWRITPVAVCCMATSLAINGLWAGPWLRDVAGFDRAQSANVLFYLAVAMTIGFLLWGTVADLLDRRGVRLTWTMGGGVVLFLLALAAIAVPLAPEQRWPWLAFGLMSNVTALAYTVVSRHFPLAYAGRATSALNLLVFVGAFAVQYAIGMLLDLWPATDAGRAPTEAYAATFGVFWLVCLLSWLWFLARAKKAPIRDTPAAEPEPGPEASSAAREPRPANSTRPTIRLPGEHRHRPSLRHRLGRLYRGGWRTLLGLPPAVPVCPIDRGPPPQPDPAELRRAAPADAAADDTFALYRIIGNELPPRHGQGQNLRSLEFQLAHEPDLPGCEKTWVLNRIVDPAMEQALIERLEKAGRRWLRIPFDSDEYARIGWDHEGLPSRDFLDSRAFRRLSAEQQASARLRVYRHKNNYVMNNNGARNFAIADGRTRARWILPWDGNCFLNPHAWHHLREAVAEYPGARYVVVPMQRLQNNTDALAIDHPREAEEEPQIAFHRNAREQFDEAHPYGRWPKAELLCRLGVPGRWDYWARKPWDLPVPDYAQEAGRYVEAGWVLRLCSGEQSLEGSAYRDGVNRGLKRAEAIQAFIDGVDAEMAGTSRTSA